jgi:hypothetical protein
VCGFAKRVLNTYARIDGSIRDFRVHSPGEVGLFASNMQT